jgi:hypothetical protein
MSFVSLIVRNKRTANLSERRIFPATRPLTFHITFAPQQTMDNLPKEARMLLALEALKNS